MMKLKWKILPLLLGVLLITGCAQNSQNNTSGANIESGSEVTSESASESGAGAESATGAESASGDEAQEAYVLSFEATTIEGEPLTSECFAQSKLTMLNVWATYCNPCLVEMPDLGEIAASYDTSEFQMIGIISDVVEDAGEDETENAKALIAETGANYPHVLLNQSLYENLVGGVEAVPTTFFVNQQGEVLGYVMGAQSKETWEEIINDLLAENE